MPREFAALAEPRKLPLWMLIGGAWGGVYSTLLQFVQGDTPQESCGPSLDAQTGPRKLVIETWHKFSPAFLIPVLVLMLLYLIRGFAGLRVAPDVSAGQYAKDEILDVDETVDDPFPLVEYSLTGVVAETHEFKLGSENDRNQFVQALPATKARLEGFVNDPRYHAMRGIQGALSRIQVVVEELPPDPLLPTGLKLDIGFIVQGQPLASKQSFESVVKQARLPDACRMFFNELAKRAGGLKSQSQP